MCITVCKESSIKGRKLVRRHKKDVVGRRGFVIAGCQERGRIQQELLEDTG